MYHSYTGYHAPLDVYPKLASLPASVLSRINTSHQVNVCVGKEWYRFPNSFFLPSDQWKLRFIKSDFRGQLPKPFEAEPPEGTRMVPKGFNDMNKEEPSRYVSGPSVCVFQVILGCVCDPRVCSR